MISSPFGKWKEGCENVIRTLKEIKKMHADRHKKLQEMLKELEETNVLKELEELKR